MVGCKRHSAREPKLRLQGQDLRWHSAVDLDLQRSLESREPMKVASHSVAAVGVFGRQVSFPAHNAPNMVGLNAIMSVSAGTPFTASTLTFDLGDTS